MKKFNKNTNRKKQIIELDSYKINENLLHLLNKARSSPKKFAKYLNINDKDDNEIINLFYFFKNSSLKVAPLILDQNLSICSKDLLEHILSGNKDKIEDIEINDLKKRLARLNLIPINYNNFIILDADDSFGALTNLFLNNDYRNTILDPDIKYIGIASGYSPSGNLIIIIDIVQSLEYINYNSKIINQNTNKIDDDNIKRTYNLSTNYTDKKNRNTKRIFVKEYDDMSNIKQKRNNYINNDRLFSDCIEYNYKYPISVNIKKKFIRDEYGNLHLIYNRESNYDDGSILIQPNIEYI